MDYTEAPYKLEPKGSIMFRESDYDEIVKRCKDLTMRKNKDYGKEDDPLWNLRMCENGGIDAWKGVIIRLSDKFCRVLGFMKSEEFTVKDEGIMDTLQDIVNYSVFCIFLYEEKKRMGHYKQSNDEFSVGANDTDNQQ